MATADDVAELRSLLAVATRDGVKEMLRSLIDKCALPAVAALDSDASAAAKTALPPHPAPVATANNQPPAASPLSLYYEPIRHGFSAEGSHVEILCMDLQGVGALPKSQTTCEFGLQSLDLRILGLNGKNYRLKVPVLEKEIKPEGSTFSVGKNQVRVKLAKKESWDHWDRLASKKPVPAAAASGEGKGAKTADPGAGIMDMMKDLYDEGDDSMKKIIAEAMMKSREEGGKPRGDKAFGGGAGGDFGSFGKAPGLGGDEFDL